MPSMGSMEWGIILIIVIILFGVGRLSEAGGALGKAVREFRESMGGQPEPKSETKSESEVDAKKA